MYDTLFIQRMIIIKFLFIILIIFLFLVLVLGSSFVKIISSLFGGNKTNAQSQYRQNQRRNQTFQEKKPSADEKKVIPSDEGEYVDFEEIKD